MLWQSEVHPKKDPKIVDGRNGAETVPTGQLQADGRNGAGTI